MSQKVSMNIPSDLLDEAVRTSGATTKTMAVILGLEELIQRKRLDALLQPKTPASVKLSPRAQWQLRRR